MSFFKKSGIVNVKMVITEEKIISNIDKIQKMINPSSKKQMVQLDEDPCFKDLIESVKTYLLEYPKKKSFPVDVYKAAYDLVEFATNQFEENTKKIEELIRQREVNIKLANILSDVLKITKAKSKNWKEILKKAKKKYSEDIIEALRIIGSDEFSEEEKKVSEQLVTAKIGNLESNMFIEIDMERIEDRSKALSCIGIEIAEALKYIPAPVNMAENKNVSESAIEDVIEETENAKASTLLQDTVMEAKEESLDLAENFFGETRFETKPSLWQRLKNSKFIRAIKYITQIRVRVELPALPEGRGE